MGYRLPGGCRLGTRGCGRGAFPCVVFSFEKTNMQTLVATAMTRHNHSPQLVPADIVEPKKSTLWLSVVKTGKRAPRAATPMGMAENFLVCGKKVMATAMIVVTKVSMPQLSAVSLNPFTHLDLLMPRPEAVTAYQGRKMQRKVRLAPA